jgi:hypothetical protein
VAAAALSFGTPFALSTQDLAYGLSFNFPSGGVLPLLAVVGTTGISTIEMIGYPLFVQETGYGAHAGPRESDGWQERMIGWLQVLKADVIMSVILITFTTVSFYIIGATIVAGIGNYPSGTELALFLARAYGEIFGPAGFWLLLFGGFFALYSTVLSTTQIVADVWPDWVKETEWGEQYDENRISTIVIFALPLLWFIGGYISGVITPLIVIAGSIFAISYIPELAGATWALYQEKNLPSEFRTTGLLRVGVVVCIIGTFILVAILGLLEIGLIG